MFRFFIALLLVFSIAIGRLVEAQGFFWEDSFMFMALLLFVIGFRVSIRVSSGCWIGDSEWIYFPLYLLVLLGLYRWVQNWEVAFVIAAGFATFFWLDYLRVRIGQLDQDTQ